MKHLSIILLVLLFAVPVAAQDATPDVGDTTIVDIASETPPINVEDGGVLVVNQPEPSEVPAEPLATNSTIIAIGALLVAGVAVIKAISQGGNLDASTTIQLELVQANREAMSAYERQYAETSATNRQVVDTLAGIITAIAPITPAKTDDTLANLLDDVRTQGEPARLPKRED